MGKFFKENKYIILAVAILTFVCITLSTFTFAYFSLVIKAESESSMKIGGAIIEATHTLTDEINLSNVVPQDGAIGYKDFSLTTQNSSKSPVSIDIVFNIVVNEFTDVANDGVLYYDLYSGDTPIVEKTMIPATTFNITKINIPAGSAKSTKEYRLSFYFPKSDKVQTLNRGDNGIMDFGGYITLSSSEKVYE